MSAHCVVLQQDGAPWAVLQLLPSLRDFSPFEFKEVVQLCLVGLLPYERRPYGCVTLDLSLDYFVTQSGICWTAQAWTGVDGEVLMKVLPADCPRESRQSTEFSRELSEAVCRVRLQKSFKEGDR